MMNSKVFVKRMESYDLDKIVSFLRRHYFKSEEQISKIKRKKILIKPNLLGAYSPEKAVTTHPIIVEAVVILLQELGCSIVLGDSPGGSVSYEQVCQKTELKRVADEYKVDLVNFNKLPVKINKVDGYDISYSQIFDDVDYIINLAKYKTHGLMQFTGAVKNLYGLIPGLKKADYHRQFPNSRDFSKFISTFYKMIKPKILLSVIDGIVGMEGKGPSGGKARDFGIIFSSETSSALDYVAAYMMGFQPMKIDLIKLSMHDDGVLSSRISSNFLWKDNIFDNVDIGIVKTSNRILNNFPKLGKTIFDRLFWYKPVITDKCKKCNVCYDSCPVDAIIKDSEGNLKIDDKKCIKCLCCHEFCVYNAIRIDKSAIARKLIPT